MAAKRDTHSAAGGISLLNLPLVLDWSRVRRVELSAAGVRKEGPAILR
jgi:hypothetical protein